MYIVLVPLTAYILNFRFKNFEKAIKHKHQNLIVTEAILMIITILIIVFLIYLIEFQLKN